MNFEKELALYEAGWDYPDYLDYLTEKADEPKPLEDGWYPARVTYVQEFEDTTTWGFEVLDESARGELEGETLNDSESKEWAETILGRPFNENEFVDFNICEGRICEAKIYGEHLQWVVSVRYSFSQHNPIVEKIKADLAAREAMRDPKSFWQQHEEMEKTYREAKQLLEKLQAERRRAEDKSNITKSQ